MMLVTTLSYPMTLALTSLAMFVAAGFAISALAYATSRYSKVHSGFIAGVGSGSWLAVVALSVPAVGRLFDLKWYNEAFALAALLPVAGYALWRMLDPSTVPSRTGLPTCRRIWVGS